MTLHACGRQHRWSHKAADALPELQDGDNGGHRTADRRRKQCSGADDHIAARRVSWDKASPQPPRSIVEQRTAAEGRCKQATGLFRRKQTLAGQYVRCPSS